MKHSVKAKIEAIERLEGDLRALASALLFEGGEIEISAAERAVRDSVIDVMVVLEPDDDDTLTAMARDLAAHPPPPDIVDRDDHDPEVGDGP